MEAKTGKTVNLFALAAEVAGLDIVQLADALSGFRVGAPILDSMSQVDMEWLASDIRREVALLTGGDLGTRMARVMNSECPCETEGLVIYWLACEQGVAVLCDTGVEVFEWREVRADA